MKPIPWRGSLIFAICCAPALGFAQSRTALDVKAGGPRTFYADSRAGNNQVSISSQSTLEDFTSVCNRVTGKCEIDPKALEAFKGRFAIRVEDIKTGIELRDTHMKSEDWLDAAKHPEIVIEVASVEDVKKTGPNKASLTLVGQCALHGKTNAVKLPAELVYLDESPETMKRAKGDLLRIRSDFKLKLSDYGIAGPKGADTIGLKVSDELEVKVSVFSSTEAPPQALEADKDKPAAAPAKPKPPQRP